MSTLYFIIIHLYRSRYISSSIHTSYPLFYSLFDLSTPSYSNFYIHFHNNSHWLRNIFHITCPTSFHLFFLIFSIIDITLTIFSYVLISYSLLSISVTFFCSIQHCWPQFCFIISLLPIVLSSYHTKHLMPSSTSNIHTLSYFSCSV